MANNLDNYIFVGTNGRVRALEILGGLRSSQPPGLRTVWTEQLKGMGFETIALHLAPIKSNNKESKQMALYGATSGFVFALDPFTGRTIWKVKPEVQNGIMSSNPMTVHCTDDRSLIISGAKGAIVALDSSSGDQVWEYILDEFGSGSAFTFWERSGMLVVANLGKLTALDLSGRLIWENYLPGKGFASISMVAYPFNPPGVTNDTLIVGTAGFILVVDMRTGKVKREFNLEGAGFKPVALLLDNKADTILSATSGELRCFRGEGLQQLWKSDLKGMNYAFGHSLLFPNEYEVIIGMNGRVANLNRGTGLVEWMTSGCGSGVTSVALLSDPTLLVCAANGSLYILNKSDGRILMKDGLSGMGYGTFSLSTTVYNTDYNSTTLPHSIMEERRSST